MRNKNLKNAKKAKNDEFYTQMIDIEKELKHYTKDFYGKVVYCNCNDGYESNFFKYFVYNFNNLGLKKLITTSYSKSPIDGRPTSNDNKAYKIEIKKVSDFNKDEAIYLKDVKKLLKHKSNVFTPLKGDGDFRSEECIELLKQSDIVCTNPPFSLFREYVTQLTEYKKKFLIIGNINAISYKEIFKLIKENKIKTGYTDFNVGMCFIVPNNYEKFHNIDEKGNRIVFVAITCWFTNLEVKKHKQEIALYKKYNPKEYPKYDNYDGIEVSKVSHIPMDYEGVMGVPITFLDKYNPEQFEIVGFWNAGFASEIIGAKKTLVISGGKEKIWDGPAVKKQKKYLIKRFF